MLAIMKKPTKPAKQQGSKSEFTIRISREYESDLELLAARHHRDKKNHVIYLIEQALIAAGIRSAPPEKA